MSDVENDDTTKDVAVDISTMTEAQLREREAELRTKYDELRAKDKNLAELGELATVTTDLKATVEAIGQFASSDDEVPAAPEAVVPDTAADAEIDAKADEADEAKSDDDTEAKTDEAKSDDDTEAKIPSCFNSDEVLPSTMTTRPISYGQIQLYDPSCIDPAMTGLMIPGPECGPGCVPSVDLECAETACIEPNDPIKVTTSSTSWPLGSPRAKSFGVCSRSASSRSFARSPRPMVPPLACLRWPLRSRHSLRTTPDAEEGSRIISSFTMAATPRRCLPMR